MNLAEERRQWEESSTSKSEEIRKCQEKVTSLQQEVVCLKQQATDREGLVGALQEDKQELEGRNKDIAERLAQLRSECNKTKVRTEGGSCGGWEGMVWWSFMGAGCIGFLTPIAVTAGQGDGQSEAPDDSGGGSQGQEY